MSRLFIVTKFHPPHEAIWRHLHEQRLRASFPGLIAVPSLVTVRHQPDPAVWLHQGHNEFSLFLGTVRAQFNADTNVQQLMSKQTAAGSAGSSDSDAAKVTKKLGNLSVGLQSLKIANGYEYLLTMTLANIAPKKSIWVAMNGGMFGSGPKQTLTDPSNSDFSSSDNEISGVASTQLQLPSNAFTQATEIKPGESVSVTMRFHSINSRNPTAGQCSVQLGFLLGDDFNNNYGKCTLKTLLAKMDTEQ